MCITEFLHSLPSSLSDNVTLWNSWMVERFLPTYQVRNFVVYPWDVHQIQCLYIKLSTPVPCTTICNRDCHPNIRLFSYFRYRQMPANHCNNCWFYIVCCSVTYLNMIVLQDSLDCINPFYRFYRYIFLFCYVPVCMSIMKHNFIIFELNNLLKSVHLWVWCRLFDNVIFKTPSTVLLPSNDSIPNLMTILE